MRPAVRRVGLAILILVVGLPLVVLSGFRLAAARRESRARADAAPPTGQFVRAGEVEMFVQQVGPASGPPVLLVHGTGAWSEIWRGTMRSLASLGYHVVAVDMPPFGFSERPATADYGNQAQARRILGVIDGLHLDRVTLVGHSFGARPTMEAFFLDPAHVGAIVLVDAALGLDTTVRHNRVAWPVRAVLATRPVRNGLVAATLTNPRFTARFLRGLIFDTAAVTPERVTMLQRPLAVAGTTRSVGEWLRPFVTVDEQSLATQRSRYAAIRVPVMVVWGDSDSVTPLSQGLDIARLIPGSRLVVLPRVGHIPAIEAPERLDAALVAFLGGLGGR